MNKTIAVITLLYVRNYGSALLALATLHVFEALGGKLISSTIISMTNSHTLTKLNICSDICVCILLMLFVKCCLLNVVCYDVINIPNKHK